MNKNIMTITEMRRLNKTCIYRIVELDDKDGFKSQPFSFEGCSFLHNKNSSDNDTLNSGKVMLKGKPIENGKFFFYGFSIIEIVRYL